ncbi:hypothetical protein ZIOFF_045030 [Zingiber officinale]|uniref:Beta-mannosidase-like galactose-binding domain-containing protein n=1 Tax=Zingiber officinale TaxID=94328 RepID=A0A8J5KXV5_ZINOF|nr:hypothetical protein ZIOFF_045030 [Zingiber officinale]
MVIEFSWLPVWSAHVFEVPTQIPDPLFTAEDRPPPWISFFWWLALGTTHSDLDSRQRDGARRIENGASSDGEDEARLVVARGEIHGSIRDRRAADDDPPSRRPQRAVDGGRSSRHASFVFWLLESLELGNKSIFVAPPVAQECGGIAKQITQRSYDSLVLTTLLKNNLVPDPFYGQNNEAIIDIADSGREYYTFWFFTTFEYNMTANQHVHLNFRAINYSADVYLNGHKKNLSKGMFRRHSLDITDILHQNGINMLAVLLHPPDHPGSIPPEGGQGGDHEV